MLPTDSANVHKNNCFYLGVEDNWRSPETYKEHDYAGSGSADNIMGNIDSSAGHR